MLTRTLAAVIAASIALAPAQATPVQGAGARTCAQFIEDLDGKRVANVDDIYLHWALGFISRLNVEREASGQAAIDLTPSGFDSSDQKSFLRKFCKDNGTKLFTDAAMALWDRLVALNGTSR